MIDSVLIPTDGSEGALAGARRGAHLARSSDADVTVLSVVDETTASAHEAVTGQEPSPFEADARQAVETVETLVGDLYDDLEVTTAVEIGRPSKAIVDYAESHDSDVIAMGTRGRTGVDRFLLGSVAETVLRTSSVPVLIVPPNAGQIDDGDYEDILLPTDGSEGAAVALDWAIALATAYDASLHALYSADTSLLSSAVQKGDILGALEDIGRKALDTIRERARQEGVTVQATVASGPPAKVILQDVEAQGIDLIVMGTRGRSGVGQHFLGSVTENVVRQAPIPVFCVPLSAGE